MKKHKRLIITLGVISAVIVSIIIAAACYLNTYYHTMEEGLVYLDSNDVVEVERNEKCIEFIPKEYDNGLIFYPGGKVEYTAYAYLLYNLAMNNIKCYLLEMPFNLAIFDSDAAYRYLNSDTKITSWYVGGHSLGGAMCADFASKNNTLIDGLILLAAYSQAYIKDSQLNVISIYGSEDKVLNKDKYNSNKSNLPSDYKELIIEGGCHSYFGYYGLQDGDGTPTISRDEQINQTVKYIIENI